MIKAGTRYVTPSGAELVVTKGGDGLLTDGAVPLQEKDSSSGFDGVGDERGRDDNQPGAALRVGLRGRYGAGNEGGAVRPAL